MELGLEEIHDQAYARVRAEAAWSLVLRRARDGMGWLWIWAIHFFFAITTAYNYYSATTTTED
jgi:hypothetical protein